MCRKHDPYIDYLQGLANEAVAEERNVMTVQQALSLPPKHKRTLLKQLIIGFVLALFHIKKEGPANAQNVHRPV